MGAPGVQSIKQLLPSVIEQCNPDVIIAQSENVTNGKSMSPADMDTLMGMGIDVFSGGNHSFDRKDLMPLLKDDSQPVIAPANMTENPGTGMYRHTSPKGDVVVISILATIFMKGKPILATNGMHVIDDMINGLASKPVAIIVNIHGDYSSDKRAFGYYLDGRVSAVIGDHWHTPTADAQILPGGTAHITDVGMCGTVHSILGVKTDNILTRMRDGVRNENELEENGPLQINALCVDVDETTGLAREVEQIIRTS